MRNTSLIYSVLFALTLNYSAVQASPLHIIILGEQCTEGLHHQPQQVFSVYVFCDSALGTNIGIILKDLDVEYDYHQWGPVNRFWQDNDWASDVTSFAWDPIDHFLYVATSSVYGTGKIYRLNLFNKTYKIAFQMDDLDPEQVRKDADTIRAESQDAIIESVDNSHKTITLAIRLWGDGNSMIIGRKLVNFGNKE